MFPFGISLIYGDHFIKITLLHPLVQLNLVPQNWYSLNNNINEQSNLKPKFDIHWCSARIVSLLSTTISIDFHTEMGTFSLGTLFFLSFVLAQLMFPTISQPAFFDKGNYTTNSPFKKYLDTLLLSISSNNQVDSRFYNASSGENPDRATVMALCRGNVPLEKCRSCVNDSAHRIMQDCPTQKEAVGWYPDCQIRYSNNSIYGVRDSSVMRAYMNVQSSDPIGFSQTLRSLLDRLRDEAASGISIKKSAAGKLAVPSPSLDTIPLVDCFPDLSSLDCNGCLSQLQTYIPNCCNARIGARITVTSCQLNYEIQPFFQLFPPPRPSLPPSAAEPPPSFLKPPPHLHLQTRLYHSLISFIFNLS